MKIIKQPWFIILILVASIYTYQFYNSPKSFQISANKAQATANTDSEPTDKAKETISVKTSKSFNVKQFNSFRFATYRNMKVKFAKTDSTEFMVSLVGEAADFKNKGENLEDWFDVSIKKKTLKITSPNKKGSSDFGSMKDLAKTLTGNTGDMTLTMIVEFPETFKFENLTVEGVSNDIYGSEISFNEFKMANVSGDLHLVKSTGEKITVETVSGDNKIEVQGLKVAKFASVSGDTSLKSLDSTPQVKFESVSGDMELKLPSDGKVDVSFESMTGDLSNAFGRADKKGSAIEFSSLSGDASIGKIK